MWRRSGGGSTVRRSVSAHDRVGGVVRRRVRLAAVLKAEDAASIVTRRRRSHLPPAVS